MGILKGGEEESVVEWKSAGREGVGSLIVDRMEVSVEWRGKEKREEKREKGRDD